MTLSELYKERGVKASDTAFLIWGSNNPSAQVKMRRLKNGRMKLIKPIWIKKLAEYFDISIIEMLDIVINSMDDKK